MKLFFKENISEPILSPSMSYPDMETKYFFEIKDLRHQSDHITPKKIQLFQEFDANPDIARLYVLISRRREIKLISDGKKLMEVEVI